MLSWKYSNYMKTVYLNNKPWNENLGIYSGFSTTLSSFLANAYSTGALKIAYKSGLKMKDYQCSQTQSNISAVINDTVHKTHCVAYLHITHKKRHIELISSLRPSVCFNWKTVGRIFLSFHRHYKNKGRLSLCVCVCARARVHIRY
jgi:hypothetical protein